MDKVTREQVDFQLENLNAVSIHKYTLEGSAQGHKLWQNGYEVSLYRCKTLHEIWTVINTVYRYKIREIENDD